MMYPLVLALGYDLFDFNIPLPNNRTYRTRSQKKRRKLCRQGRKRYNAKKY